MTPEMKRKVKWIMMQYAMEPYYNYRKDRAKTREVRFYCYPEFTGNSRNFIMVASDVRKTLADMGLDCDVWWRERGTYILRERSVLVVKWTLSHR